MEYTFKLDETLQDLIDTSITDKDKQNTYGVLVSKFIRQYYPEDRVEAILNNKLADPTEQHQADFDELQVCRAAAKIYAKELLGL